MHNTVSRRLSHKTFKQLTKILEVVCKYYSLYSVMHGKVHTKQISVAYQDMVSHSLMFNKVLPQECVRFEALMAVKVHMLTWVYTMFNVVGIHIK
jgi:hypothetical protein